ncbi:flagellar assembly protein FliH [Uliginosibacterium sp. H1]|uniref:flagellar assembly protein FliH n=1 Tax=Uliginosibacterium sp. H1 TaxID=3114757 RepID=UPI002E18BCFE|nr:flagellar assembly protein FliH [Uliginosibacterium sp. H1]
MAASMMIPANQASGAFQRWEPEDFALSVPEQAVGPDPVPEDGNVAAAMPATEQPAEDLPFEIVPGVALPTAEDIERIQHDAAREGYAAGYEEGAARGRMEAAELHQMLTGLDEALSHMDQQIAHEIQALALEIARQVVRDTVVERPEALLTVIREALNQLPQQHATIRLNPADAALARQYIGEHFDSVAHRIVEDDHILRGGCTVEAAGTQIDAQLQTRWRRVVEHLSQDAAQFDDHARGANGHGQ